MEEETVSAYRAEVYMESQKTARTSGDFYFRGVDRVALGDLPSMLPQSQWAE